MKNEALICSSCDTFALRKGTPRIKNMIGHNNLRFALMCPIAMNKDLPYTLNMKKTETLCTIKEESNYAAL